MTWEMSLLKAGSSLSLNKQARTRIRSPALSWSTRSATSRDTAQEKYYKQHRRNKLVKPSSFQAGIEWEAWCADELSLVRHLHFLGQHTTRQLSVAFSMMMRPHWQCRLGVRWPQLHPHLLKHLQIPRLYGRSSVAFAKHYQACPVRLSIWIPPQEGAASLEFRSSSLPAMTMRRSRAFSPLTAFSPITQSVCEAWSSHLQWPG